jgi:hypothetical protein
MAAPMSVDGGPVRSTPNRTTADLSAHPDLVVIYRQWWQEFLRDRGGTGFWHETYFRNGQIESVYIDMPRPAWPGSPRPRPPAAHCSPPAAGWACGKEANHRRASQKTSCISGEATASLIARGARRCGRPLCRRKAS